MVHVDESALAHDDVEGPVGVGHLSDDPVRAAVFLPVFDDLGEAFHGLLDVLVFQCALR